MRLITVVALFFMLSSTVAASPYLEIRNVELSSSYAEYDLYFVFDESFVVQDGKVLGIRIHEYGVGGSPSVISWLWERW